MSTTSSELRDLVADRPAAPAGRARRLPRLRPPERPWEVALFVLVLLGVSLFLRTRAIDASLWADEGISEGIASRSPGGILSALQQDGAPPLYYLLLHAWIEVFGSSEAALHGLSLLFATLCIPAALWAGWTLFGRNAGLVAALLAAVNPYLSGYAVEARMYTLLTLVSLLACTAFVKAFVHRDRRYLPAFAVLLALTAYVHNWGLFLGVAAAATLLVLARRSGEPRALLRDGLLGFGGATLVYLPWLPTLFGQAAETGAPWARRPAPDAPLQVVNTLFGGEGAAVALALGAGFGAAAVLRGTDRRNGRAIAVLLGLAFGTLLIAWVTSQLSPAWTGRYFGAVLGALLLASAAGLVAGRRLGLVALVLVVGLWVPKPSPTDLQNKSNADVLAAWVEPQLRPGDVVLSTQPEQVPLLRYYLDTPDLRFATVLGPVPDPGVMDWRDALDRMEAARPRPTLARILRELPPGGRLLYVAPVTEQRRDWRAPWTELVRRRSAQFGALLEADPRLAQAGAAPPFYRVALTVGLRGVLYERVG